MVESLNGGVERGTRALSPAWEIVTSTSGRTFLGRVTANEHGEVTLDPAYLYVVQASQVPGQQSLQISRQCVTVDFFPSSSPMRVRWSERRKVDGHSLADQAEFLRLVQQIEDAMIKMRAAQSGLTVASSLPHSTRQ